MKKKLLFLFIISIGTQLQAQKRNLTDFFLFFMNNEYDSALVFLEQQIEQNPENKHLQYYLGKTHLALNNYSQSVSALRKALEGKKSDARIYQYLGQVYEDQGMLPEAIEAYETIGQFRRLPPAIQLKLAYLYFKQSSYDATIKIMTDFMKQDSTHLYAHYLLSRSYLKKDVYDNAIVVSARAIKLDSTSFPNYLNLGIAYYKKVIAIDPEFSFGYYNLAITYDDFYQEKKTAIQYYKSLLRWNKGIMKIL